MPDIRLTVKGVVCPCYELFLGARMSRVPSRGSDQFNLRLPDGMRDQIAALADANGRSMNAEIVTRLQASLDIADVTKPFGPRSTKGKTLKDAIDVLNYIGEIARSAVDDGPIPFRPEMHPEEDRERFEAAVKENEELSAATRARREAKRK